MTNLQDMLIYECIATYDVIAFGMIYGSIHLYFYLKLIIP